MDRAIYFPADATIAVFQPGDGTKYEFIWANAGPGCVHVASINAVRFDGSQYSQQSILRCYNRNKDCGNRLPTCEDDEPDDYLLPIVGHSNCNPWTAWAMVQCLAERWISNQVEDKR